MLQRLFFFAKLAFFLSLVQCDYILLGFLVYQMATGKRPYEDIHSLEMLVIATLAGKVNLNVEAEHFLQNQQVKDYMYV